MNSIYGLMQNGRTQKFASCATRSSVYSISAIIGTNLTKHYNSRKCGKCVCEECSKSLRKLSKKDKNFYRTCDYCDNKMGNREIEEKFKEVISAKENMIRLCKEKGTELTGKTEDRKKRLEALEKYVFHFTSYIVVLGS